MSNMLENPFLNNKTPINHKDENSGETVELDQENVSRYFSHVYVLAKRNNDPIPVDFYSWQLDQDIFNKVADNILIHKTSVKVLKNKHHFDSIVMMSGEQLKKFNIFNYELGNKNIVLPIFNIAYQNLLKYLEQYETTNTLENVFKTKVLNKYFGIEDSNYKSNEFLNWMISNMEDSNYWTQYYNCLVNFTSKFHERGFIFQSNRIENKLVASIVKEMFETKAKEKSEADENYIEELNTSSESKKDEFVDISSIIQKKGYRLYHMGAKSEFSRDDIVQLFGTLNEKQKFTMFANLVVSKKHAHLVLNNEPVLTMMSSTIKSHAPLFRYLMSYAWIKFYFEECIKKSFVQTSDDFIFDINTASKLPVFPFSHKKPKENPYMPILVDDSELKPDFNVCGIPDYWTSEKTLLNAGICNLDEFKIRMNIFCTGNPNFNMFEGFDFAKHKVGITGSIITACIQKSHPLMSRFTGCDTQTERFNNYFNEYYAKSDIDVMFMAKDNFTFIDNVHQFHNQIVLNVCKINSPYAEPEHIKLKLKKLGYLFVSEDFINKNIKFDTTEPIDNKVKYVMENINDESIRAQFRPYYEQLKNVKVNELIKDFTPDEVENLKFRYPEIFSNDEVDFRIYVNRSKPNVAKTKVDDIVDTEEDDEPDAVVSDPKASKDIDLVFTYKFKIESPHINHSFELFPVRYDDFFSIVARFHLPCVRGYYDGSNVYLTPSCISAHMTYMNIDYKYVCGTKDPLEIINKNRIRGFGTWLNSKERKVFTQYSRKVPFWNNLYNIDSKLTDADADKQLFGPLSLNHKMFRPRLYNMEEYVDSMYVDTANRYNDTALPITLMDQESNIWKNKDEKNQININQVKSVYQERFGSVDVKSIDYDSLHAIDANGYVVPLKKWVIDMTWEIAYGSNQTNGNFKKKEFTTGSVGSASSSSTSTNTGESKIKKILSKTLNPDIAVKLGYPN